MAPRAELRIFRYAFSSNSTKLSPLLTFILEMSTLCNACGINYRRALSKTSGLLDLDALARSMGPSRPSIQKSLKRLRRSAYSSHSSKRTPNNNGHGHGLGHNRVTALPLSPMSPVGGPSGVHTTPSNNNSNIYATPNHSHQIPPPQLPSFAQTPPLHTGHQLQPYHAQQQLKTPETPVPVPPLTGTRLPPIHVLLRGLDPAYPTALQHPQEQQHYEYNPGPQPPRFG